MVCFVTPRDEVLAELTGLGPPAGVVGAVVDEVAGVDVPQAQAAVPMTTTATTANQRSRGR